MDLSDVTAKAAANVSEAGQKHLYPPPADLAANAHVKSLDEYKAMYDQSINDPETFFGDMARQFHWEKPFDSVGPIYNFDMSKGPIKIDWFQGGTTNICYNALDRHVAAGAGDSVAILWEGNSPDEQASYTYNDVLEKVKKFANVLKSKGVKKGDTVTLYMPMVVELGKFFLILVWEIILTSCFVNSVCLFGLRSHRGGSLRGVRRVQPRGYPGPDGGRAEQGCRDVRRGDARRQAGAAQDPDRRRAGVGQRRFHRRVRRRVQTPRGRVSDG